MEENMNENINVKKKSNVLKYALTFVGGAAIGAGALFGYNTFMDSKAPVTDNTSNTEVGTTTDTENTDNTEVSTPQTTINMPTTLEYGDYYLGLIFHGQDFTVSVNGRDLKSASIGFSATKMNNYFGNQGVNIVNRNYVSVNVNMPKPIVTVLPSGSSGFGEGSFAIYFLLTDGTVYSINTLNALKSVEFNANYDKFPAPTLIEGLDNVASIRNVSICPKTGNTQGGTCGGGSIAIKSDGTIVPLSAK